MKKLVCLSASILLASMSNVALSSDGTITINGKVTDTTCNISVNGGNASNTVTLPTVSASALAAVGATATPTPFTIVLSGCTGQAQNSASTFFESGINVDANSGRLNNVSTDQPAGNVQVQLLNKNRGVINIGSALEQGDIWTDFTADSTIMTYIAQYYATDAATAGNLTTSVTYSVVYK
ncbi:fimbrial protein [Providencia sp.]